MTNEELYKAVEAERAKKAEMNKKWDNFICPVCGENHFKAGRTYSLLEMREFMNAFKGRHSSGMEYKVTPYECQECGYVVFRKAK